MKKYNLIYVDPPWSVKKIRRAVRPNQVEFDYPVMSVEDICNLGVPKIADDSSHLFLWATQAYLRSAFVVMDCWGFRYQQTITWDKRNGLCLFGFHYRTEFLLHGYRGKVEMYPKRKTIPTVYSIRSGRHSEKPDEIRRDIEIFGDNRIELFARKRVDGWDCWGNEVDSDIEL